MESKLSHRDLFHKILDLKSNENDKVVGFYDLVQGKFNNLIEQSSHSRVT